MVDLRQSHEGVLRKCSRPIVHLRQQIKLKRFGLVFGSGISKDLGIPNWEELVGLLANDPAVDGEAVRKTAPPRAGLPYRTEMLFEHYKRRRYTDANEADRHTRKLDIKIASEWREIIRQHLYAKATNNIAEALANHPYLRAYLPLLRSSYMTVTYNFDNLIEQALSHTKKEKESRGFETVTNPWTQFRRREGIIYHPNGVILQNLLEAPSDRFVFSEAAYAEQLMGIHAGDQAGLINHLSKHTCLFIGLSLEDETLRNVLMQAARACPGNFHYYIHYLKDNESLDDRQRHAIRLANFKVYNLITLFLGNQEIYDLGELINIEEHSTDELCEFAKVRSIEVQYRFYIVGPLGVGKSTTINQFRNLTVYDEWMEERIPELGKDWEQLTELEKNKADDWIADQFDRKNAKLRREHEGIFMLDRAPLDPLVFTPQNELSAKASKLLDKMCPNRKLIVETIYYKFKFRGY